MLKTRSSGTASIPGNPPSDKIRMIEDMWQSFSSSHEHLASMHNMWRIGEPIQRLEGLASVLEFDDFWMHEHAFAPAAEPWPPLDGRNSSSTMVNLFTGFGSLELHLLTLNIKSITNDLAAILAFRKIPRLHVTFHVAMGRR
jgi:hypothetical protein